MSFFASSRASSRKIAEISAGSRKLTIEDLEWQTDHDKEERKCTVSLWTRPLEEYNHDDITMMHWAIVFEWDDRTATYEANDDGGYLLPKWYDGPPKASFKEWEGKVIQQLGEHMLSPKKVNQAAKNNRLNCLSYMLGHVNCQEWVVILTDELGISLPQETIAQNSPMLALGASAAGFIQGNQETLASAGTVAATLGVGYLAATAISNNTTTSEKNEK
ncbi:unnamed protein product [Meganyctiphanes norvegica]|uniref:Uncharacterized protein n=1 Tax=Meganyctiphanes norvegica TaxID=48144 RepID=A0AAV2Q0N9_MEGNR